MRAELRLPPGAGRVGPAMGDTLMTGARPCKSGPLATAEWPAYLPETMRASSIRSTSTRSTATDHPLRIVVAGVLIYLVGLICFFPDVITVYDEEKYLEAAYAFSKGSTCLDDIDPLSGEAWCILRPAPRS